MGSTITPSRPPCSRQHHRPCKNRFSRGIEAILSMCLVRPALARKDSRPLCHKEFLSLERCIGSNYDRLRAECSEDYDGVRACLERDWRHIDDAHGYKRSSGSFNRMKQCRHGVMLYNPLDWYIGRGLEVYGEWGEKKVQVWQLFVKPGHVVVDVGAHVGALTLPLSAMVGEQGKVVAFEPFYPSFASLAANVGLNSLQNVEVRQAVIADKVGRVFMNRRSFAFKLTDFFNFGSINFNGLRIYNATDDVERATTDWDEYLVSPLDQMSLGRLDFLKIDAEAMELKVIQGAMRMIKKFKPVLFVEYRNPWEKDPELLRLLEKTLKYECVLLRLPVFNSDNIRGHVQDIWGIETKLVSFNLLCKHRWWEYPDMDGAVLELFETAVDTDIDGLRTTPSTDPLGNRRGAIRESQERQRSGSVPEPPPGRVAAESATSGQTADTRSKKHYADVSLDELLDDGYAEPSDPGHQRQEVGPAGKVTTSSEEPEEHSEGKGRAPQAPRRSGSHSRETKPGADGRAPLGPRTAYQEMTIADLMEETAAGDKSKGFQAPTRDASGSSSALHTRRGELPGSRKVPDVGKHQDLTLEELLGSEQLDGGISQDGLLEQTAGASSKPVSTTRLMAPPPAECDDLSADCALNMKANAELQEKLQKRLTLQNETPSARTPRPTAGAAATGEFGPSSPLAQRLGELSAERDRALEYRRRTEDEGMHKTIELSSEVARLRVDVEVMRKDLESARREVQELRLRGDRDRQRDQEYVEQSVQQDLELAVAEARLANLSVEVATSEEEKSELEQHVKRLEEEVASHVVSRVRMEALLRKSKVREVEMRKLLDSVESGQRPSKSDSVHMFSMHVDDDEDEKGESDTVASAGQDMDDLEFGYEVAELAGAMSMERALELARAGSFCQGGSRQISAQTEDEEEVEVAKPPTVGASSGGEQDYEAPLRELQLALAHIRSGAGSGGPEDTGDRPSAAGTGEAADGPCPMDQNLGLLHEVLGRLTREVPPPEVEVAPQTLEKETEKEKVSTDKPLPFQQHDQQVSATPAAPAVVPPSPRQAEPSKALQAPLLGGFGLFSPYAAIGQKYAAGP